MNKITLLITARRRMGSGRTGTKKLYRDYSGSFWLSTLRICPSTFKCIGKIVYGVCAGLSMKTRQSKLKSDIFRNIAIQNELLAAVCVQVLWATRNALISCYNVNQTMNGKSQKFYDIVLKIGQTRPRWSCYRSTVFSTSVLIGR